MHLRMPGVRDIIELNFDERYNPNHDPKNGQFTEGDGGGYVSPDNKKVVSEINDWY